MPTILYYKAQDFLENYLPDELTFKIQNLTSGGKRIMLYWKEGNIFFQEFGRDYLGETNTNETHKKYIETLLNKAYKSLKIRNKKPSFKVDELLANINWLKKEKASIRENYF
jgi:hypothetical protein